MVRLEDGRWLMTYTAFDGITARLMVATSPDLETWTKHGPAFGGPWADVWSKSGSVVARPDGEDLVAARLHGEYWMYWGESNIYAATSPDGIAWTPVNHREMSRRWVAFDTGRPVNHEEYGEPSLTSVFRVRRRRFDSLLVEPGPPALLTPDGIVLLYNSANHGVEGRADLAHRSYRAGQILLDPDDPTHVIARATDAFFVPEREWELRGQVDSVTFLEGLIRFRDRWWLYYGTADSCVAVATTRL